MEFKDLKVGDTFVHGNMIFTKKMNPMEQHQAESHSL